jgi:hypothetical protein
MSRQRVFQLGEHVLNVLVGRALGETCEMTRYLQHLDEALFVIAGECERIRNLRMIIHF